MKSTGIVRRIDDLGRIHIPKEVLRNRRIKEGAPLEIWIDSDGGIILKKYDEADIILQLVCDLSDGIADVYEQYNGGDHKGEQLFEETIVQVRALRKNLELLLKALNL